VTQGEDGVVQDLSVRYKVGPPAPSRCHLTWLLCQVEPNPMLLPAVVVVDKDGASSPSNLHLYQALTTAS
jgi:hypothetical protein